MLASHADEDRTGHGGRDGPGRCAEDAGFVVVVQNRSTSVARQMNVRKVLEEVVSTLILLDAVVVWLETERASIRSNNAIAAPASTVVVREGRKSRGEK